MDGVESQQLKELTASCLQGNADARRRFQDLFGESIYHHPVKMFGLPKDKAADFFIYVLPMRLDFFIVECPKTWTLRFGFFAGKLSL